jgi:2-oxoglutarate ferredoxin oxidoreductase subunit gamma
VLTLFLRFLHIFFYIPRGCPEAGKNGGTKLQQEIIFAGIGGQGVQTMGKLLANAAMEEGKEVIWRPAYQGVMRGNISNCIVNISDEPISSFIVDQYDVLIALNQLSLTTLQTRVKKAGILIWESTKIKTPPTRGDIRVYGLPAYNQAITHLNNAKLMNMIMLGALIKINPMVKKDSLIAVLKDTLPPRFHHLIPLNEKAIELGMR